MPMVLFIGHSQVQMLFMYGVLRVASDLGLSPLKYTRGYKMFRRSFGKKFLFNTLMTILVVTYNLILLMSNSDMLTATHIMAAPPAQNPFSECPPNSNNIWVNLDDNFGRPAWTTWKFNALELPSNFGPLLHRHSPSRWEWKYSDTWVSLESHRGYLEYDPASFAWLYAQ